MKFHMRLNMIVYLGRVNRKSNINNKEGEIPLYIITRERIKWKEITYIVTKFMKK